MNVPLQKKSGFSLVELLVVIAIIAVLMTLLAPAMRAAQDKARHAGCLNNVRTIMQANTAYCADHNGILPGPNWRKAKSHGWLYYDLQMDRLEHLRTGDLWPYIREYGVYRCPADEQPDEDDPNAIPNRPNNSRMITSFCLNGSVIAFGAKPFDGTTGNWSAFSLSSFRSDDILYWETDETKAGGWWWDGSNFPYEGMTYRHLRKGSMGSADGHVEAVQGDDYYKMAPTSARRTRLWNVPGSINGRSL